MSSYAQILRNQSIVIALSDFDRKHLGAGKHEYFLKKNIFNLLFPLKI